MMLSNTLKEIAADYGVFVYTGTQVNREWEKRHFRNENNIAGSKAIADKIDFGVVAVKVDEEEKEKVRDLLRADGIKEDPNVVIDIYKNRRGRVVNAKLYRIFDYGTCRTKDLMLTDTNYNKIHGIGRIERKFIKRGLLDLMVSKHV
jgi:replicative DNA helicase